jgi:hypothetical protein
MKRLAAIAATLLACPSAFALTVEWASHQTTVALGQTTRYTMEARLIDEAGQGAPGVGYTFTVDGSCATFEDGSTTFSGVSDEAGLAFGPRVIGHTLAAACQGAFTAEGLAEPVPTPLFVFDPADVVLSTAPAELLGVPLCRTWKIAMYARVGDIAVHPHALEVSITAGSNGATGTIVEIRPPFMPGGSTAVVFTSNDKQGRYELQGRYGAAFVAMPVEQKKNKYDCSGLF